MEVRAATRALRVAAAVEADLAPAPAGGVTDGVGEVRRVGDDDVDEAELAGQGGPLGVGLEPDDGGGAEVPAEHRGGQPDRTEPGDEQPVPSAHPATQQPFVCRPEAARDQRAVDVGQALGQRQARHRLGQHEVGMAAVALPAVGGPGRCGAADRVADAALVAGAAAGDVVDRDALADLERRHPGPELDDVPAGLVAGDDALVGLGAVAEVLAVDRPDVAAADRRRTHPQQHLPGSRRRHVDRDVLDRAVPRQPHRGHGARHGHRASVSPPRGWMIDLMASGSVRAAVRAAAVSSSPKWPVASGARLTRPDATRSMAVGHVLA